MTWVFSKSRFSAAMTICRVKRKRTWILNSLPSETGNQTPSGLGSVDGGEADAGDVGAEQDADAERKIAGERGSDDDGFEGDGVDPGVALPADVVFVFGVELDVEGVAAVAGLAAAQGEGVVGLLL